MSEIVSKDDEDSEYTSCGKLSGNNSYLPTPRTLDMQDKQLDITNADMSGKNQQNSNQKSSNGLSDVKRYATEEQEDEIN